MTSLEQYSVGINIVPVNEGSSGNAIQIPNSNQNFESYCLSNIVAIHKRSNIMLCHRANYLSKEDELYFIKQHNKYIGTATNGVSNAYRNYGRPMNYKVLNTCQIKRHSINRPTLALSLEAYNIFLVITSADSVCLNFFSLFGMLLNGKHYFNCPYFFLL